MGKYFDVLFVGFAIFASFTILKVGAYEPPEDGPYGDDTDTWLPDPGPVCELQPLTGNCRGHIKRYYYNINAKMCQPFVWGGCEKNSNHFQSLDQCRQRCLDRDSYNRITGGSGRKRYRSGRRTII